MRGSLGLIVAVLVGVNLPLPAQDTPAAKAPAQGTDWPQWGRDYSRNMVSPDKNVCADFDAGKFVGTTDKIDPESTRNVKWIAKLGSQSYGNPTVAGGRIYVGTNNDSPRDPKYTGDRSVVYCFDTKDGSLLWQLNVPKLGTGKVSDWEYLGICSSPAVEGDRVYLVTNRCEVMCLDVHGMANGNQGYQDEGQYVAGPGNPKMEIGEKDADIIWFTNMTDECGVFPHNITCCSVMIVGDRIWTSTSNGVDYGHVETPAPNAPSFIVLDKKTGKILAEEASGCSQRILHSNWSSPAYLKTADKELAIFGGPDGRVYAFHKTPKEDEDGFMVLDEAWRFDCNPKEYRVDEEGKPRKYATRLGPSEVLGTPIVHDGKVYALIGQDPEHGEGIGNLTCIDADGKEVWSYRKINRSMSTMSIEGGLLFAADYSGFVYCLDAATGKEHWVHDTAGHIWGSTLVADGKLFIGSEDGFLTVIPATKEYSKDAVKEIDMTSPIYSSPIVAQGVLYVATHTHLFAIRAGE
ncbi:MAG: PQQ-binding-like beta-propeller repeat protein [Planctomycetes bacterium]|nr:PQQ-binding-like beta-propeller repeat protein [Planctomycetota bacterium]MCB9890488.1 PQQ-binding-like beta-propeller repeat protein [Planctomycetota bacterium]MCB9917729.1 PQQ-binding-like beta-propeller repeat protein [Planctomycetota bacterium]